MGAKEIGAISWVGEENKAVAENTKRTRWKTTPNFTVTKERDKRGDTSAQTFVPTGDGRAGQEKVRERDGGGNERPRIKAPGSRGGLFIFTNLSTLQEKRGSGGRGAGGFERRTARHYELDR